MEIVGGLIVLGLIAWALAQWNHREPIVPGYFELYMMDDQKPD
jgi:hypothetical protein